MLLLKEEVFFNTGVDVFCFVLFCFCFVFQAYFLPFNSAMNINATYVFWYKKVAL